MHNVKMSSNLHFPWLRCLKAQNPKNRLDRNLNRLRLYIGLYAAYVITIYSVTLHKFKVYNEQELANNAK